jgi:K(+)-stimulated pyrophosphate-energized sodium pump
MDVAIASLLVGIFALAFAGFLYRGVSSQSAGNARMQEIAAAIREGAMAYLNRQYRTIAVFAAALVLVFIALGFAVERSWFGIALAFAAGAASSALAGYIGMDITSKANVRTAEAAKHGLNSALGTAFRAGAVMGLAVVGLGLIGVSALYLGLGWLFAEPLKIILGMGFGASLIAMFARVGGGIYTKGADVGADLVGKIEAGIPEDDPRNPAVIADNVGDNVGDCAGMGADLFESYIVTIIATMVLGAIAFGTQGAIVFPLAIGAAGIVAAMLGTFFVRAREGEDPMRALNKGIIVAGIASAAAFYFVSQELLHSAGVFYASLVGLAVALAIVQITDYYTSKRHAPVRGIAEASKTGAGTNVITGLAVGLQSTALPALVISAGILLSYNFAGIYGIAVAAMAMLSMTGIIVAVDSFGPVSDNAGGIAEMAELPAGVRRITDALDAVGNTTKATTKGFAIGSAGLAALSLLLAFTSETGITSLDITKPVILVGLFIGSAIPFLFSAFTMQAVGRAAFEIVNEVRRQFREIKGIMHGKARPDYARCVDISTRSALRELVAPALLAVSSPLLVGFLLGPAALGGLLVGSIATGMLLALQMCTGGGAWDNAKKYIEEGNYGGKGTPAHAAAVVGDTVGDPFKDTAGPSLNALIKVLNTISIVFASLFVAYSLKLVG